MMAHWLAKVTELLSADTSNLRELAEIAGADPATFYIGIDPSNLDLEGQDVSDMQFFSSEDLVDLSMERFYSSVLGIPRREERVAMLLNEIMEMPPHLHKRLIEDYPSQTVFELRATNQLSAFLPLTDNHDLQALLFSVANNLYGSLVSYDKGQFLLFLAEWVGRVDSIAHLVETKLRSSQSRRIQSYSGRIKRTLASRR